MKITIKNSRHLVIVILIVIVIEKIESSIRISITITITTTIKSRHDSFFSMDKPALPGARLI